MVAIILLCGILGNDRSVKPLTQREYTGVVRWLIEQNLRPASLLDRECSHNVATESGLDVERLTLLLDRGVQLGFVLASLANLKGSFYVLNRPVKQLFLDLDNLFKLLFSHLPYCYGHLLLLLYFLLLCLSENSKTLVLQGF